MSIKVLVVDDSSFFRRRVAEILSADPNIEVIATATNGREAIEQAERLRPDVITMDIEMPVMDGITALRHIVAKRPTQVLMFSSLTHHGARSTLDALDAGAADYLPKRFEDIASDHQHAANVLIQRVKALGSRPAMSRNFGTAPASPATAAPRASASATATRTATATSAVSRTPLTSRPTATASVGTTAAATSSAAPTSRTPLPRASGKRYKVLLIGTSTGGPVALQTILTKIPADYPLPILLVQHMPAAFTPAFAQRLNGLCQIEVKEAEHGDRLRPGCAYLAPGGKQMLLDGKSGGARIAILDGDEKLNYKPSVDITFGSASRLVGGDALAVILTGMGADGREGCRLLKRHGATIWAQDAASCVVYGMPQAVTVAGLSSHSIPLASMAESILRETHQR